MTPRERLVTALDHREPDRVPFDLGTTFVTGITRRAYRSLLEALGEEQRADPPLFDPVQQLVVPDQDILDRLGVDTTALAAAATERPTRPAVAVPARWWPSRARRPPPPQRACR